MISPPAEKQQHPTTTTYLGIPPRSQYSKPPSTSPNHHPIPPQTPTPQSTNKQPRPTIPSAQPTPNPPNPAAAVTGLGDDRAAGSETAQTTPRSLQKGATILIGGRPAPDDLRHGAVTGRCRLGGRYFDDGHPGHWVRLRAGCCGCPCLSCS